jgi:hypothetical protein
MSITINIEKWDSCKKNCFRKFAHDSCIELLKIMDNLIIENI